MMEKHLKIIRMLYSPHLVTEILLAVELVLVVQLLALSTASVSYIRQQTRLADSYWSKGGYLYYTRLSAVSDLLDPQEVLNQTQGVEEFYQGAVEKRILMDKTLQGDDGNRPGVVLVRYNTAMVQRASGLLDIREESVPEDTIPICVPPDIEKVYPIGTVLTLQDYELQSTRYMVCGIILEEQIPVIDSHHGNQTMGTFTMNVREQRDNGYLLFISLGEENIPVYSGMFQLAAGRDEELIAAELSSRYENNGHFYTYASKKAATTGWGVRKSLLLQAVLFVLVFVSHFIGYLVLSTRNKERTNALLSVNGLTSVQLGIYNACAILLILLPSFAIGALLVPLEEKQAKITAYGGHTVMWEGMALFGTVILLLAFLAVRSRMKKGNTILLYREGM